MRIVVSGPGSGKTHWLVKEAKRLSSAGKSVAALAFNRKAAAEIATRIGNPSVYSSTIHALAYRLVRKRKGKIFISSDYTFDDMMKDAVNVVNNDVPFDEILIDEAQDLDPVQLEFLKRLGGRLTFIGDMDQSIYSWRGAIENLFEHITPTEVLYLDKTWRVPSVIYDRAYHLISKVKSKYRKKLSPVKAGGEFHYKRFPNDEVGFEYIKKHINEHGVVLFRTNNRIERFSALTGLPRRVPVSLFPTVYKAYIAILQGIPNEDALATGVPKEAILKMKVLPYEEATRLAEISLLRTGRYIPEEVIYVADAMRENKCDWLDLAFNPDVSTGSCQVMTMHASKGLEFEQVFVEVNDALTDITKPEEVRLLYVAMTRAKKELHIIANQALYEYLRSYHSEEVR